MAGITKEAMNQIIKELEGRNSFPGCPIEFWPTNPRSKKPSGAVLKLHTPFGAKVKKFNSRGKLIHEDDEVNF